MNHQGIACCYHPTTVVFVDDNRKFLNSLRLELDRKNSNFLFYDDPISALQYLNDDYQASPFINRCLLHPEESYTDHRNIDINVRAIHEEIYNPDRFNEVSVVVVDYAMPGLNGLELCQQLKKNNYKIILLTGEADDKLAIDAFNKGIIQRFIRKDDSKFAFTLNSLIAELQHEYFLELSEIVINGLTKNPDHPVSSLKDPAFVDFFHNFFRNQQLSEYYLMQATGSFLFLDLYGKPSWLVISDDEELTAFASLAEDDDADTTITNALKNRQMLPYFHSDKDFETRPSAWQKYLHPAQKLVGQTVYYYTYITDAKNYDIQSDRIKSYQKFLAMP